MTFKKLSKLFEKHSVAVSGEKGSGKDVLFANVIARRKQRCYISNMNYKITNKIAKKRFIRLNLDKLLINNKYDNFIKDQLNQYIYPYQEGIDIYISDCGVYFPSQYCNELNAKYKEFPGFMALSRHLGKCWVHTNCQAPNRVWDKIREQSSRFINCRSCLVLFGTLVIMRIRIYERYQSFVDQVQPFRAPFSLNKDKMALYAQERVSYENSHGLIKSRLVIGFHKAKYDDNHFKDLLEGGVSYEEKSK